MTEEVLVRVTGIQRPPQQEEAEEPISVMTTGHFFIRDGVRYVCYEEIFEEAGVSTTNTVKILPDMLEVKKEGAVSVEMLFQEHHKTATLYGTPFGDIEMGIATTRYRMQESQDKLDVSVAYALELNGEHAADCELRIEVIAKGSHITL